MHVFVMFRVALAVPIWPQRSQAELLGCKCESDCPGSALLFWDMSLIPPEKIIPPPNTNANDNDTSLLQKLKWRFSQTGLLILAH